MSAPVKFLAVAVAGWVTFRAAASALVFPAPAAAPPAPSPQPAGQAMPAAPATAAGEPGVSYAPLAAGQAGAPPVAQAGAPYGYAPYGYAPYGYAPAAYPYPAPPGYAPPPGYGAPLPARAASVRVPIYYPVPVATMAAAMPLPRQRPWAAPVANDGDAQALAAEAGAEARPQVVAIPDPSEGGAPAKAAAAGAPRLDRWSLSSWSLIRQNGSDGSSSLPASPALATGGQLGASQAGSRLTYNFTRRLSANLRFSAPLPSPGSRSRRFTGGEGALGIAWQPLAGLPLRVMAERRQRFGRIVDGVPGGRNAFALLAEGGVYGKALPLGFLLDGYGQSGIVSARQRDWFVDGGLVAQRSLFGRYSAGLGLWGGAQKGLNRLDVGPRVSARLTPGTRLSLDYRYRAFGNAAPGSGFAVSLGSDF